MRLCNVNSWGVRSGGLRSQRPIPSLSSKRLSSTLISRSIAPNASIEQNEGAAASHHLQASYEDFHSACFHSAGSSHQEQQVADNVVPEAVSMSQEQGDVVEQESENVWVEEEIQEVIEIPVFRPIVLLRNAGEYLTVTNVGRGISLIGLGLFAATLVMAVQRAYQKTQTVQAKRMRMVDRNKKLVGELSKILPQERSKLSPSLVKSLQSSTGFNSTEVFRKYMWFTLRERKFDHEAVDDLIALKAAAGMRDEDVAEAIRERAQRIYDRYGTLMLNTEGFTAAGLERKATCKSLSQKLLFLSECEALVKPESKAAELIDLRTIFGATEEDMIKMRIASLNQTDLEDLFQQSSVEDTDAEDDEKKSKSNAS